MSKPTDRAIITFALALLRAGILASSIPNRLMEEYSITAEKARELASAAIRQHRKTKELKT
jgi:hypothetical protein